MSSQHSTAWNSTIVLQLTHLTKLFLPSGSGCKRAGSETAPGIGGGAGAAEAPGHTEVMKQLLPCSSSHKPDCVGPEEFNTFIKKVLPLPCEGLGEQGLIPNHFWCLRCLHLVVETNQASTWQNLCTQTTIWAVFGTEALSRTNMNLDPCRLLLQAGGQSQRIITQGLGKARPAGLNREGST